MELSFNDKRNIPLILLILLGASQSPFVDGMANAVLNWNIFGFRVGTIIGIASIIIAIGIWKGWF